MIHFKSYSITQPQQSTTKPKEYLMGYTTGMVGLATFHLFLSMWNHWPLGKCGSSFKIVISEHMLLIEFRGTTCEIALKWMPQNIFDDKSTLVQVMVPSDIKPLPEPMLTLIYAVLWVTGPQWVKFSHYQYDMFDKMVTLYWIWWLSHIEN